MWYNNWLPSGDNVTLYFDNYSIPMVNIEWAMVIAWDFVS